MTWEWFSKSHANSSASNDAPGAASSQSEAKSEPRALLSQSGLQTRKIEDDLVDYYPGFADHAWSSTPDRSVDPPSKQNDDDKIGLDVPYPTTMSCRESFDLAFDCSSMSGQFRNIYRYGSTRRCSDHWSQFWFCMRNRQKSEHVKAELISQWYRKKEEEKYAPGKPNCENVWEKRLERYDCAYEKGLDSIKLEDSRRYS